MIVEIVILAMVAAFLGLRLYSVLGRRAEHNEEPIQGPPQGSGMRRPDALQPGRTTPARPDERAAPSRAPRLEAPGFAPSAEQGIRAIIAADRRFDVSAFLEGAKGAYAMVLEAFWRGDKDELAQLCDSDVLEGFVTAIDARAAAGETLDNRLIRIEEASIDGAEFDAPMARVRVRFVADIASVTRDAEGHVIAGSLDDAIESRDVWTFMRDVNSRDPDWLLDETDEG
ncbi:MAG TPA: Tim44/TimA family putative adaptor protein [Novosphingobium sp.]|nr:Tim44/TimA family putative adaptor protein [Novosphingobium sp.]